MYIMKYGMNCSKEIRIYAYKESILTISLMIGYSTGYQVLPAMIRSVSTICGVLITEQRKVEIELARKSSVGFLIECDIVRLVVACAR